MFYLLIKEPKEYISDMDLTQKVSNCDKQWFALSAPYCREMSAKSLLENNNIETFIPMKYELVRRPFGKVEKKLVPAIHNLLFARSTKDILQQVKSGVSYIQYLVRQENGKNMPITVPDAAMEQFISVSRSMNKDLLYLSPDEICLEKGTKVRIRGGKFDGICGIFLKLKGLRNKRLVIQLDDIAAIATADISDGIIEVLD